MVSGVLAFFAISCKKEVNQQPMNLGSEVTQNRPTNNSVKPYLKFNSLLEFKSTMDLLVNKDELVLNAWEKSHLFESQRTYFDKINPDSNWVPDMFLSTVLSPQGVIQIGTTTYIVGENYLFKILELEDNAIPEIISELLPLDQLPDLPEGLPDNVEITKITDQAQGTFNNSSGKFSHKYDCQMRYNIPDGNRRDDKLVGEIYNVNYYFYASMGAKSKNVRVNRKGTGWNSEDADYLILDAKVDYVEQPAGGLPPVSHSKQYYYGTNQTSSIGHNFYSHYGDPNYRSIISVQYMETYHFANDFTWNYDPNPEASCTQYRTNF